MLKHILKLVSLCVFSIVFMGCPREGEMPMDDMPMNPTTVACDAIGGDYSTSITLTNINDDPDAVDYCVIDNIEMRNGAGFIIEPGVVIEFDANTNFSIYDGYIMAEGTADSPIIFRGIEETPGIWGGIEIGRLASDVRNILDHCIIEYAGSSSNGFGLRVEKGSGGGSGLVSLKNSTIRHTLGAGFAAEGENSLNEFANNHFENNSREALLIHAQDFSHIDSNTTFEGNGTDGVVGIESVFGGRIWNDEHHTWNKLSNNAAYYLNSQTYIDNGSLTLAPGVDIVVGNGIQLAMKGSSYISAIGTPEEPITIRGEVAGSPSWNSIYLSAHFTPNVLEYCHISEAGVGIIRNNSCHGEAAIGLDFWFDEGAMATIRNCTISHSANCGIFTDADNLSQLTQADNVFTDSAGAFICD